MVVAPAAPDAPVVMNSEGCTVPREGRRLLSGFAPAAADVGTAVVVATLVAGAGAAVVATVAAALTVTTGAGGAAVTLVPAPATPETAGTAGATGNANEMGTAGAGAGAGVAVVNVNPPVLVMSRAYCTQRAQGHSKGDARVQTTPNSAPERNAKCSAHFHACYICNARFSCKHHVVTHAGEEGSQKMTWEALAGHRWTAPTVPGSPQCRRQHHVLQCKPRNEASQQTGWKLARGHNKDRSRIAPNLY